MCGWEKFLGPFTIQFLILLVVSLCNLTLSSSFHEILQAWERLNNPSRSAECFAFHSLIAPANLSVSVLHVYMCEDFMSSQLNDSGRTGHALSYIWIFFTCFLLYLESVFLLLKSYSLHAVCPENCSSEWILTVPFSCVSFIFSTKLKTCWTQVTVLTSGTERW